MHLHLEPDDAQNTHLDRRTQQRSGPQIISIIQIGKPSQAERFCRGSCLTPILMWMARLRVHPDRWNLPNFAEPLPQSPRVRINAIACGLYELLDANLIKQGYMVVKRVQICADKCLLGFSSKDRSCERGNCGASRFGVEGGLPGGGIAGVQLDGVQMQGQTL